MTKDHFKQKLLFWLQVPFKCKIFRSHYVTLVLRRAYLAITNLPLPLACGWEVKDDVHVPIMTYKIMTSPLRINGVECARL